MGYILVAAYGGKGPCKKEKTSDCTNEDIIMPKSKLLKSPSLTVNIEEEFIYLIYCKNIHDQEIVIGTEPTLASAEEFKHAWIENHSNRYWCKEGSIPDVYFKQKPVLKGGL